MAPKKRKSSKTNASVTKKKSGKNETKDMIMKTPLLVSSNEKLMCDNLMKPQLACKVEEKVPEINPFEIKISCVPLNIEKIIDFKNNKVIVNQIQKNKKQIKKNLRKTIQMKTKSFKSASKKDIINCDGNPLDSQMLEEKTFKNSKKKLLEFNEVCSIEHLSDSSVINSEKSKKTEILYSETQWTFESKSLSHNFSFEQQTNLQASTVVDFEQLSSENLNSDNFNVQGLSCGPPFADYDEFPVTELCDINLEKLPPPNEKLKMKLTESENKVNKITEDVATSSNALLNPNDSTTLSDKDQCDLDQVNYLKRTSLQAAVEAFMKSPQSNYLKENTALKKGLCFSWLSNNYVCFNQQCTYNHNALNLFTKKLKQYPSKFIMTVVVSMRNDILFVDVIMAALKIMSERQIPMIWITLLVYFVFYVTEPSDSKFLKFWVSSARFFCQSNENYTAANGFTSLLSIFSQGEKSEEWKIIEFIKLIKQPPVQIPVNYALLQPILKMDLPFQFLTEAVESSITAKKDVANVFMVIIPKIPFMTSPIRVVELLLKFCQTLEEMNLKNYSGDLKQRLKTKILSLKMKITQSEYPLTASFQEEINSNSFENNGSVSSKNVPEEPSRIDLETSVLENNYFKLEDFCNLMNETVELPFDTNPGIHRNAMKFNKSGNTTGNKVKIKISYCLAFRKHLQKEKLPGIASVEYMIKIKSSSKTSFFAVSTEKVRLFSFKNSVNTTESSNNENLIVDQKRGTHQEYDVARLLLRFTYRPSFENYQRHEEDVSERQITRIRQFFHNCQFDLLGKYLNELESNVIERAAQEFLKLSFKMKITLHQVVDLVRIIVLPCKSESATKIIASISITLILNLVRINEWEKAYTIVSLCQEKRINLVEGKVFYFNEYNVVSQCRIALLLIEIYAYKSNFVSAIDLVKKYNLYSTNNFFWKLTWKTYDETIRIRILEDVLQQIISNQITEEAYNLFEMIYKEQNQLLGAIDLKKFVNDILILLLNQNNENAISLYKKIKTQVQLHETTLRAILITLVRHNCLPEAKNLLLLPNQNTYSLPEITEMNSITVVVSSFWLEEELYLVFDEFFDLLISKKQDYIAADCGDLEIEIRLSLPKKASGSNLRPLCLGIIKPSFKDACARIQRVLQYQFNPPIKLVILPYSLKLDEITIKHHLCKRMNRNSS